ncbi:MAG: beta-ketoacyl-[acyl-carrier-protein] synthase II [Nitrospiraceae bacterium]|nr:MAG: beta-ketoacyl-[acyl-carrier-protein] synthase II [Nitrospiraceae bacterium]
MKRVVITGIGAVTPLGNDIETTWENLTKNVPGISHITKFDPSGLKSRIAGELRNFNPGKYIQKKDILRLDPFIHYAASAAIMAAENSGIGSAEVQKCKSAVVVGSSRGGITSLEKAMENNLVQNKPYSAYLMSATTINMASSYISISFGIKGPSLGISTACASGTHAIGEAVKMIRNGEIDIALAGGAEAPVCRLAVGGYAASGALSRRNHEPQKASRPFDMGRDGFVISEGAGILVLEELNHALKRGARIYAELAGYGTSSDAFHQTKPDSDGESRAIRQALHDAGINSEKVDYINAHATSTPLGDITEAKAIREVFGTRTQNIHVSSCKSMLGHMLGAAGAVETAISALSIHRSTIIPTINLEYPDPACDLNHVTSLMKKEINIAVTNSFGFGGSNAVLVLRKFTS